MLDGRDAGTVVPVVGTVIPVVVVQNWTASVTSRVLEKKSIASSL